LKRRGSVKNYTIPGKLATNLEKILDVEILY